MKAVRALSALVTLTRAEECANDGERTSLLQTKTKQKLSVPNPADSCPCDAGFYNTFSHCVCEMVMCAPPVCDAGHPKCQPQIMDGTDYGRPEPEPRPVPEFEEMYPPDEEDDGSFLQDDLALPSCDAFIDRSRWAQKCIARMMGRRNMDESEAKRVCKARAVKKNKCEEEPPVVADGSPPERPPIADGSPPREPEIMDGQPPPPIADGSIVPPREPPIADGSPEIMDGTPQDPEHPIADGSIVLPPDVIVVPPPIADGSPEIMDGTPQDPEHPIADGSIVLPPDVIVVPPREPPIADGSPEIMDGPPQDPEHPIADGSIVLPPPDIVVVPPQEPQIMDGFIGGTIDCDDYPCMSCNCPPVPDCSELQCECPFVVHR